MKIWDIIKEDFEKETLEEGWKSNVLATVLAVSSLFNTAKAGETHPKKGNVNIQQNASKDSLRLDISKLFQSGQYVFHEKDANYIKSELLKLGQEIEKSPVSTFQIQIVSSESQVTNYDNEPGSPTYKQKLDSGALAKKRAETISFIISNFAKDLKDKGILKGNVEFVNPKILVGNVPWPSVNPSTGIKRTKDDPAYSKDQYTFVNIKIVQKDASINPFDIYADMGEKVNYNGHAFAMIFYPTRKSSDVTQAGNKNTGYENVLLKTLRPESELTHGLQGKKDEKNVYSAAYVIPWQWWNQNVSSNTLTPENIKYITSHFAIN